MISLLRNTFVCLDMKLVRTLFTVYVRPLIEFEVPVWCPYLREDINQLEKIQHRVTILISGYKDK